MNEILSNIKNNVRAIPALTSVDINPNEVNKPTGIEQSTKLIYDTIGKIAAKADQVKLTNEKIKIQNQISLNEADFRAKYLTDPTIYDDKAKMENVMKAYESTIEANKNLILDSQYLNEEDIRLFDGRIKKSAIDFSAQQQYKFNQRYISNTIDENQDNIVQSQIALSNLEPDDPGYKNKRDIIMSNIVKNGNSLRTLGVSDTKVNKMISSNLLQAKTNEENKAVYTNIVASNKTTKEKLADLKLWKDTMESDEYKQKVISELTKDIQDEDLKKDIAEQYEYSVKSAFMGDEDTAIMPLDSTVGISGYEDINRRKGLYYKYKAAILKEERDNKIAIQDAKDAQIQANIKDAKLKNDVIALREKGDYLNAYRKQAEQQGIIVETEEDVNKHFYDIYGTGKNSLLSKDQSVSVISRESESQIMEVWKSKELSYSQKVQAVDKILPKDSSLKEIELKHLNDVGKIDYDVYTWTKEDATFTPVADSISVGNRYTGRLIFKDSGVTRNLTKEIKTLPLEKRAKVQQLVSNYIRGEIVKIIPDTDVAISKNLNEVYRAATNAGLDENVVMQNVRSIITKANEDGIRKVNVYRYKENIPTVKPKIQKDVLTATNINDAYSKLNI